MLQKKRWQSDELAMVFILICVSVVCVLMGSYTMSTLEMQKADMGYYGDNTMSVILDGTQKGSVQPILEFVQQHDHLLVSVEQMYIKRILFKGSIGRIPIVSGRFFNEEDFFSGNKLAVLGRTPTLAGTKLVYQNNTSYVEVDGDLYEVIGRIGYSVPSPVDNLVFINLDGKPASDQYCRQLILSFYGTGKVENLYPDLFSRLNARGFSSVPAEMPKTDNSLMNFFDLGALNTLMLAFAFFAAVLATLPISAHWVRRRKKSIAVKRFLGFGTGVIVGGILVNYFILFNIGFAGGYVLIALASAMKLVNVYSFFSGANLISYLVALGFNLLVSLPAVCLSMRVEPGDALRRA